MSLNTPQPTPGTDAYNNWVAQQNADLAAYRREYERAMAAQGITVTWNNQDAVTGPYALIDPGNAVLTKDGFSSEVLVSRTRAQNTSPEQLAAFDQQFNLRFNAQTSGNALPSIWFVPESNDGYQGDPTLRNAPGPHWSTPGPTPTVPPVVSTQTTQAPPSPDSGTLSSGPSGLLGSSPLNTSLMTPTATRRNWDEWNYLYKEDTGREGPPPEDIPGAARGPLYTREEWWALAGPWYTSGASGGGGIVITTPGGGGGGGGTTQPPPPPPPQNPLTPAKPDYTVPLVVGGIIALLALWK